MIKRGLLEFKGKRILLLQGPLGPFFWRLKRDLESVGAHVYKINFNGGDWLFYPFSAVAYRGGIEDWPIFFEQFVVLNQIDIVMLFGDCRPMHRLAHEIAQRFNLEIGVFEEGYIRPDYITLERFGVNGHSLIPRDPQFYMETEITPPKMPLKIGHTFWYMAACAASYYLASMLLRSLFRHYRHHRPLSVLEVGPWLRAFWRKTYYKWREREIEAVLINRWSNKYFLVPLQVHNDAQIHTHSEYSSVEAFIEYLMRSFALNAPADTMLVIKHHPMDRGYHDYSKLIATLAKLNCIEHRVAYIHDQHLPTLLHYARGVVVINSTVGLSALHHNKPLKTCGNALYDMAGLTYQFSLDHFWIHAQLHAPDYQLFERFQAYLTNHTQLNGNFYKRIDFGKKWCAAWALLPTITQELVSKESFDNSSVLYD